MGKYQTNCDTSDDENLLANIENSIKNGIKKWSDEQAKQLINIIESIQKDKCKFIKLFAMKIRSKNGN